MLEQVSRPGNVRVIQDLSKVLLDTCDASTIEFRDRYGNLNAIVTRHFTEDMWIFVSRADPDWEAHLVRLGYQLPSQEGIQLFNSIAQR
jgi:hypothetical protein